jgi:hypothetical protein
MPTLETLEVSDFASTEGRSLVIGPVAEANEAVASGVLGVLQAAYTRVHVDTLGVIPAEHVADTFDPFTEEAIAAQAERMQHYMETQGSRYWLALDTTGFVGKQIGEVVGVVKISPSRPGGLGKIWGPPNAYLNDVAVSRPAERIATALLYEGLGDYDEDKEFVTDGQRVNTPANNWFARLGAVEKGKAKGTLDIGETKLQQVRMGGVAIGDVREALATRLDTF